MAQQKTRKPVDDPTRGPSWFSIRMVIAFLLFAGGIAWIACYYVLARPEVDPSATWQWMTDLERWNYLIGFGALMIGLTVSAHKSTPMGNGRGVVIGMVGCFLAGLVWICTFYIFSDDLSALPVFNDLGQFNLLVGIAFMATGFTFATRWE